MEINNLEENKKENSINQEEKKSNIDDEQKREDQAGIRQHRERLRIEPSGIPYQ